MVQAHSRSRQSKVVEAAKSALQDLGVHQTDSAPPSIQNYHNRHWDQYASRGECYSDLGGRSWGREKRINWAARREVWTAILKGLCRSSRMYSYREIGERVLPRAKALGLTEDQITTLKLRNLGAEATRKRVKRYGLNTRKTACKSGHFSKKVIKKQTYVELCSKNTGWEKYCRTY